MLNRVGGLLCAAGAASVVWATPAMTAENLYKWVDENGNVTYQDRPPPEQSTGEERYIEGSDDVYRLAGDGIVLYAAGACDACDRVRDLLVEYQVPFEERNPFGNAETRAELEELSGSLSVPVLLIANEVLAGYDEQLISSALARAGFTTRADAPAQSPQPSVTREELERMTPAEVEQAARDAVARGVDNDLFERDEGYFYGFGDDRIPGDDR